MAKKAAKKKVSKKISQNKTKLTARSVSAFIKRSPAKYHADCEQLTQIMSSIVGEPAVMWGDSIVGFGKYHYKYDSGREGDSILTGFSPRSTSLTLYIMSGFDGHEDLIEKIGKCKTSSSCLYIKKLDDIHLPSLKTLIRRSVKQIIKRNQ